MAVAGGDRDGANGGGGGRLTPGRAGLVAVGVLALGGTLTAVVVLAVLRITTRSDRARPHAITVDAALDRLAGGGAPPPLRSLSEHADVTFRAAPGGRGTEVHTFPLGDGSRLDFRWELRRVKQLVEVGEVLLRDPRPTGRRGRRGGVSGRVTRLVDRALTRGGVS